MNARGRIGVLRNIMTVYDLVFTCPDLKSQADVQSLKESLSLSPGVDTVEVNIQTKRVHVVTAAQDAGMDIRRRLSAAGFPAEDQA